MSVGDRIKRVRNFRGLTQRELGISKPYAYKIIRRLNEEFREKGMITIAGRVDGNYFNERYKYPGKRQTNEN